MEHFLNYFKKSKFIIFLILLVLFITACSQSAAPDGSKTGSEIIDMEDHVFNFTADIDPKSTTFLSYNKDSVFGELAINRFAEIEAKYNCTITKSSNFETIKDIVALAATGDDTISVIVEHVHYGGNSYKKEGLLLPMSEVSDIIDYTDSFKWGSKNILEIFMYETELYGLIPASWPENIFMSTDFLLVVNEDMVASLGKNDPREYVEKNEWNRDTFVNIIKEYYHQDNNGDPVSSLTFGSRHMIDMSFRSFGVEIAQKIDNKWVSGYASEKGIAALEWAKNFLYGELKNFTSKKDMKSQIADFIDSRTVMSMLHSNYTFSTSTSGDSSSDITNCGIQYGILPFPSGDGTQYIAQYERVINGIMIPSFAAETEWIATIVNDIFEPLDGYDTIDKMKDYYTQYLFFDKRDTDVIMALTENARYLFHDEGFDKHNREIENLLLRSTPAEVIEKMKPVLDKTVEEEIAPVFEAKAYLFGD